MKNTFYRSLLVVVVGLFTLYLPTITLGQSFWDMASETNTSVPSDDFIAPSGQLLKKSYHIENEIISDELLERRYYDRNDRLVVKRFYDHFGELYYDETGISIYEFDYDAAGNRVEVRYYDEYKQPFQINFIGPAAIQYEYNENNQITTITYLNANRDLCAGTSVSVIEYNYDAKKRLIEELHLNNHREPITFFAPITKYRYDDQDRIVEKAFYTQDGLRTARMMDENDTDQISIIRYDYSAEDGVDVRLYRKDGTFIRRAS